ncbi:GNAT family N-acetyltransferase [Desulfuribacillus alkaliarsenatis]|uniref:GNAT family N-acetyltransferase n=1 Tax=Desulfuribacillus alkaliarsenatis TaxID=766136 RepID=A0A1E5G3N8_9FIRM|nr:GNAT family N-acetyltransferase [Desulfuribacillus alkaliarsenatis]
MQIREAKSKDFPQIWQLLEPVFKKGDSYPHPPDMTKEDAFHAWMEIPTATYIVIKNKEIIGTYYIKTNQIGLGSHVCNCGYVVGEAARGYGLGRIMCEHSKRQAKKLGYKAMQYNLVVSTNEVAVHLWKSCGFELIGTLPKAFNHLEKGFVDAHVMYLWLD